MQMLVVSLVLYLASHVVRMARLWLLIGGGRLRELLRLYWYTTAVSLAMPFKTGELIRILEIGWSTKGPRFGLVVVWVERAFDAALLSLAAIGLAYSSQDARPLLLPLIGVLLLFVALSLIFLWVVPENLPRINLHIMRLYSGRRAVRLMRSIAYMKTFAEDARRILRGRMATFAILTLLIWTFELFAIASVMAPDFPAITGFTELLTKLVPGLSQVESSAGMKLWTMTALSQTLLVLVFGLVALFPYIRQRLNGRGFTGNRDDNAGCLR
ncbi:MULTISPECIES: lysylphosphatidylglycerol synthase domain-containing protein [Achromobacter]|nr:MULTISPECIES: lysylphosphatidylglycerol synthase domain-containing protein [Achromobacter]